MFGRFLVSKSGQRKHVSLANVELMTALLRLYRQTYTDKQHIFTILTTLTLCGLLILYVLLLFMIILVVHDTPQIAPVQLNNCYLTGDIRHSGNLRQNLSWAVVTLLLVLPLRHQPRPVFSNICDIKWPKSSLALSRYIASLLNNSFLFFLSLLNLLLIVIATPSIVNPGPFPRSKVSVVYCNAQGLIMMSSIRSNEPIFQTNKLMELQSYLHVEKPDIAIINETWLNEHVNSNEIVKDELYKCLRHDRTAEDKQKYNKKGGSGVMILCRQDINVGVKAVKIETSLPIISAEVKFADNTKICISTFYRYGYSDINAFRECMDYYTKLSRKFRDIILIGDLNLSSVSDWTDPVAESEIENMYVDLFHDLGLQPLVNCPTHRAGNTLDQILTNRRGLVRDIAVEPNKFCSSDHYTLSFNIGKRKNRVKPEVRKVFAYSKADWVNMNRELQSINWPNILTSACITENLNTFKSKLDITMRKWIPTAKIKQRGEPAWYDAEIKDMTKNSFRLRKKASETGREEHKEEYKNYRKRLKHKITTKKKEFITTVDPCESHSAINKRFWAHVKSNTKGSSRIPETVHYNSRYRTVPGDKAELYNTFFCEQFSDPSSYNIDISYSNSSPGNDLFITPSMVFKILKEIKPS